MKIQSSTINMASQNIAMKKISTVVSYKQETFSVPIPQNQRGLTSKDSSFDSRIKSQSFSLIRPEIKIHSPSESMYEFKITLLKKIIEMMYDLLNHKNVSTYSLEDALTVNANVFSQKNAIWYQQKNQVSIFQSVENSEFSNFSTVGSVKTADGRSIDFNINLEMSQSFSKTFSLESEENELLVFNDPLVINFDASTCAISDQSFFFDLDCNGTNDNISVPKKGSGFLALDKNGNNTIDNGSELFGTKSGNGFYDLMQYDDDKNGWIDENDNVFKELKVLTIDKNGDTQLMNLKDANIGAIFLGNVETGFDLNTEENHDTKARIQSTGIFLRETDGSVGTIQHVDFAV